MSCCSKNPHLAHMGSFHAGASLVELYSAFAYDGPSLVPRVKRELAACLARDGFDSVTAAVGADLRQELGKEQEVKEGAGGSGRRWLW